MQIKALQCPSCGDIIYSRHKEDLNRCYCGLTTITGGPFAPEGSPLANNEFIELTVDVDEPTLTMDWLIKEFKYGTISEFIPT
jgi:hypothetical protein